MRKNIKEAIASTVRDMIEANLKVSDALTEYIEIAKIVKKRRKAPKKECISLEESKKHFDINPSLVDTIDP
jgi:exoribonuclease R